ncbi:hypothetical protein C801_00568 [Bacteroides uniformis dnLKV2]|uniref:Uncharacterized protein n=1 Tax=Bacteroides uniformis dnLKV2 TaxID=1235787 RepID=R9I309_BACUN|nr:hypothetical protein C801_00568 [Bacteroides uniformis dnLKV2]
MPLHLQLLFSTRIITSYSLYFSCIPNNTSTSIIRRTISITIRRSTLTTRQRFHISQHQIRHCINFLIRINTISCNRSKCSNKSYSHYFFHNSYFLVLSIVILICFRIYPFNGKANMLLVQFKSLSLPKPPFQGGLRNGRYAMDQQNVSRPLLFIPFYIFFYSLHLIFYKRLILRIFSTESISSDALPCKSSTTALSSLHPDVERMSHSQRY